MTAQPAFAMLSTVVCLSAAGGFHVGLSEAGTHVVNELNEEEQNWVWAVGLGKFVQQTLTINFY